MTPPDVPLDRGDRAQSLVLAVGGVLLGLLLSVVPAGAQASAPPAQVLIGVNVVPMDGPAALLDQAVVIDGGRIQALGPRAEVEVPEGAEVLDLTGRWVLPGLVDMHVHLFSPAELSLYLDHGVTTVRNMWGWELHLELRAEVAAGSRAGPTIFTAGPMLDGDPPRLRGSAAVATGPAARAEVARQARAGFDGVKVYDLLTPRAFAAAVLAAARYGLPVWGHPPASVGLDGALVAGLTTVEHLYGVGEAAGADGEWDDPFDPAALADLALRVREAGAAVVPTLVVLEARELPASAQRALVESPAVARLPVPLRSFAFGEPGDPADDLPATALARRRGNRFRAVRAFHREGVRILAGTDTGNPWVLPGVSLVDELELLHEAGLSRFEALRAATRDAALVLGAVAELGTLAPGTRADLVVVDGSPLEDLGVLRAPVAVMARGRWHQAP